MPGTDQGPVVPPAAPSKPMFKVDADTIVAFVIADSAFVASVFPTDPKVALICQLVGGSFLAAAGAFHLDGK